MADDKWGDPISEERQAELRARAERQKEWVEQPEATRGKSMFAGVRLTGADVFWLVEASGRNSVGEMSNLHLEGANLSRARLAGADLSRARLAGATLIEAQLEGADLGGAHLERTNLVWAHLERAYLRKAQLVGANLFEAHVEGATLIEAQLAGAELSRTHLERADLSRARLVGANLLEAHLARTNLLEAHLARTNLGGAQLEGAELSRAQMEGAELSRAQLEGADLTSATFDKTSHLNGAVLTGASLDQATYDGVNLTVVDWSKVPVLGDELTARQVKDKQGKRKSRTRRIEEFTAAVRAYRVLAVTLRGQGMNEDADRYAYRAQRMQRVVLRLRRRYLPYLGSLFIDLLAGYGFRPERSLLVYLAVILWFANFYVWASHGLFSLGLPPTHVQPLAWYEGLILSVSSFHGRGFQPFQNLNDPIAALAGIQAVFGLIIEVSFIATFTQRFFAR